VFSGTNEIVMLFCSLSVAILGNSDVEYVPLLSGQQVATLTSLKVRNS